MKPKAQLLVLAGLLATAVTLLACLPAEEASVLVATPWETTATPPSEVDEPPTPALLTPTPAAEAGRPDCPQDWAAYEDPDGYFSLCYPPGWEATAGVPPRADFGHEFSLRSTGVTSELSDSFYLFLYWQAETTLDAAVFTNPCKAQAPLDNMKEVSLALGGQSVLACVGDLVHTEEDRVTPPFFQATSAQISLGPGEGSVRLYLSERKDTDQPHESQRSTVLESLQVGQ